MTLERIDNRIKLLKEKIKKYQLELEKLEKEKVKKENEAVIQAFRKANIDSCEAIKRIKSSKNATAEN